MVKSQDWNDYEVYCKGDLIRLHVNGLPTAGLRDSTRLNGVLALQVHRGPPMEVRFRNVRIKALEEVAPAGTR